MLSFPNGFGASRRPEPRGFVWARSSRTVVSSCPCSAAGSLRDTPSNTFRSRNGGNPTPHRPKPGSVAYNPAGDTALSQEGRGAAPSYRASLGLQQRDRRRPGPDARPAAGRADRAPGPPWRDARERLRQSPLAHRGPHREPCAGGCARSGPARGADRGRPGAPAARARRPLPPGGVRGERRPARPHRGPLRRCRGGADHDGGDGAGAGGSRGSPSLDGIRISHRRAAERLPGAPARRSRYGGGGHRRGDRRHDHGGGGRRRIRGRTPRRPEDRVVLRSSGQPRPARLPGGGQAGARPLLLHRCVGHPVCLGRGERGTLHRLFGQCNRPGRAQTRPATGSQVGCARSGPTRCGRSRPFARPASASTWWCSIRRRSFAGARIGPTGSKPTGVSTALAIQLLAPGGWLVSASCSAHLEREKHLEIIARVAYPLGRHPRVVGEGGQDRDHPIHPALPETGYLRAFFVELD